jgi:hypothetical protein
MEAIWKSLLEENEYGECAARDIEQMVFYITCLCQDKELSLGVAPQQMMRQILNYIMVRHHLHPLEMNFPQSKKQLFPEGWTQDHEDEWLEFLDEEFTPEVWQTKVIEPVFGSGSHIWENGCEGWRDSIPMLLSLWIQRSYDCLEEPEEEEEEMDKYNGKIDPYLIEHGTAKQRRMALRQG